MTKYIDQMTKLKRTQHGLLMTIKIVQVCQKCKYIFVIIFALINNGCIQPCNGAEY